MRSPQPAVPPDAGVRDFKVQFKKKAGVDWERRKNMVAKPGKYQWIERAFEDEKDEKATTSKKGKGKCKGKGKEEEEDMTIPESKLEPEIQALCQLMFSTKYISTSLLSKVP